MDIDDVTEHVKLIIKMLKAHYGESLNEVINIFFNHKYEIRLAGETARDIIMNKIPRKLELLSSAPLHQTRKMFARKKIPISIDEKGMATVTYLYHSYKIGTIWPIVEKSSQPKCADTVKAYWMINAYQRLFTVDSTTIDFSGRIYDSFNACEDIFNCNVRMMTIDPDSLIKNDYLKIFTYFKLFGSVAGSGRSHDDRTLKSIMDNMSGLANIKGELIWSEFKTLLLHPKRYECVESFLECGGGAILGIPENPNLSEFKEITSRSDFVKNPPLGISYMCAFLQTAADVMRLHKRVRLTAYERDLAIFLVKYKAAAKQIDDLIYYRQMCLLPSGKNKQICREYVLELLKYHNKKSLFEELLLMPSPSCIVDPAVLQWKKIQLRSINECKHDDNPINESPSTENKRRTLQYPSTKKKQRLL